VPYLLASDCCMQPEQAGATAGTGRSASSIRDEHNRQMSPNQQVSDKGPFVPHSMNDG
jgi:hypothetical protein